MPTRLVRLTLIALLLLTVATTAAPAFGAGEAIKGRLRATFEEERTPVPDVTINVFQDGQPVGSAVSSEDGTWLVPVPGAGTYQVGLDVSTLPDGVGLTDPERVVLPAVEVGEGQEKTVIFRLGPGASSSVSTYQRVGSLTVLGLKLGAVIALSAIGLSLVFQVTGLVNFAHAEMVTLGAISAYLFHGSPVGPQWPLAVSAIFAVSIGASFGFVQEKGLWKPLRMRQTSLIAMMVVSIGLSFAMRNFFLIVFDGEPRAFPDFAGQSPIVVLGIPMVPKHLFTIFAAAVILGGLGLFLSKSRSGTALRAVSDNKDLAESSGIDVNKIIALTWVLAGGLAATGGVFFGLTETVQWDMGFRLLLLIFAAVVLGGLGTTYGVIAGAMVVGLAVELSTLLIPNELKMAVGLIVLIIMLLVRPQGLLGTKDRIG